MAFLTRRGIDALLHSTSNPEMQTNLFTLKDAIAQHDNKQVPLFGLKPAGYATAFSGVLAALYCYLYEMHLLPFPLFAWLTLVFATAVVNAPYSFNGVYTTYKSHLIGYGMQGLFWLAWNAAGLAFLYMVKMTVPNGPIGVQLVSLIILLRFLYEWVLLLLIGVCGGLVWILTKKFLPLVIK